VNSRRAPQRILFGQAPNEIAARRIDAWSSRTSRAGPPAANERSAVPSIDGGRLNQHQCLSPPWPYPSHDQPQQTVRRSKTPIRTCADSQLVAQGEDLEQEVSTRRQRELDRSEGSNECCIGRSTATDYTAVNSVPGRDIGEGQVMARGPTSSASERTGNATADVVRVVPRCSLDSPNGILVMARSSRWYNFYT
jgi:hypothetical protein